MKLFSRTKKPSGLSRPVIVVSGLPRSGTSMMMRMLAAGGIEPLTDGERAADADNPGGYYELERVKKLSSGDDAWLAESHDKVVKVIAALLLHLPEDHDYKVIFMRRRMDEILASQRQMLINRGEDPDAVPDEVMAGVFAGHLERVGDWLARENVEWLDVDYNELVAGGGPEIAARIAQFLERPVDLAAMEAIVDPTLYRRRS